MTLADDVSARIIRLIADGTIKDRERLPSESLLGDELGVSRLTVREALKVLSSQGVLTIAQGRGTFTNPMSEWQSISAVSTVLQLRKSELDSSGQLLGVRRPLEIGAAELAALHRTDEHLHSMRAYLNTMRSSHHRPNVDEFVDADISFHATILRASKNLLLPALMHQLSPLLATTRLETSMVPVIRQNAIRLHQEILDAISSGDSEAARLAMTDHMDQTLGDLERHVQSRQKSEIR